MSTLKAVRGTRDLLPAETGLWNRIEATARSVFERYGFGEIRTPIFEDTALFARGVGEDTDIVSKEMYSWSDGERFNEKAMVDAWLTLKGKEVEVLEREGKSAGHRLDLVVRYVNSGVIEIVEFKHRGQLGQVEQLRNLVDAYRAELPTAEKRGRLVYPKGKSNSVHFSAVPSPWIDVEEIDGSFFYSSQNLTLRPENTAGVVRAYIENKLGDTGQLQKLYYMGPQFRRERPMKGRYRQFSQIGAEVIGPVSAGSESPLRDAEVLEMLATLLDELGISGWVLKLNSVGSASDRPKYIELLRKALEPVAAQMCVDCQRRAVTNPLRVLDCKVPEDQPFIEALPKIADSLDEDSTKHFAAVLEALDAAGVPYIRDHRLVRGLDYYTRTTFEFTHDAGLGTQNALLGGGRYDGLSELIGGPKAPGIGFAMGEDRLVLTLLESEKAKVELADAYVAPLGEGQNAAALKLARELRRDGLKMELGDGSFRLKKSFEAADKVARAIVLLGEDEVNSGILTVKVFATPTTDAVQSKVDRAELAGFLRSLPR